MPLIKKKKSLLKPDLKYAKEAERNNQTNIKKTIEKFLKEYNNIVVTRINRAIITNRCFHDDPDEYRETLFGKFRIKFCRVMSDNTINMDIVTPQSMNVMIQRIVNSVIIDEIRLTKREKYINNGTLAFDLSYNSEPHQSDPNDTLMKDAIDSQYVVTNRFMDGASAIELKQLWRYVRKELKKYDPNGYKLLKKLLNPNKEDNMSSPKVHQLKKTIVAIMKGRENAIDEEISDYVSSYESESGEYEETFN